MEREEKKDVKRKRYRKEEQYVVLRVCERGKRDRSKEEKRKREKCASGSVGGARPCQGRGRGFESRLALLKNAGRQHFFYSLYKIP